MNEDLIRDRADRDRDRLDRDRDRSDRDSIYKLLREIQVGQGKLETSIGHIVTEQERTSVAVAMLSVAQATVSAEVKEARDDLRVIQTKAPAYLTERDLADTQRRLSQLEADKNWISKKLVGAALGSGAGGGALLLAAAKLLGIKVGGP